MEISILSLRSRFLAMVSYDWQWDSEWSGLVFLKQRTAGSFQIWLCISVIRVSLFIRFQIELTDDKIKGLMIAIGLSVVVHMVLIIGSEILSFIFHFNSIEKASIIIQMQGIL